MKKTDIFISYGGAQGKKVADAFRQGFSKYTVQQGLEENALQVFLAPESIAPGKEWEKEILRNLQEADTLIFIATRESDISTYAQQELGGAWAMEKKIYAIWGDERNPGEPAPELPGFIKKWHAIDLNDPSNWGTGQMIGEIIARKKEDIAAGRK